PDPFNDVGVTMGHWHIISKDPEANKKIFLGMGGKLLAGAAPVMMFPHVYINLTLGDEKAEGGSQGSVVNHVGFIVDNVQQRVAEWKAAGVAVLPRGNRRAGPAHWGTPDGGGLESLEAKTPAEPHRQRHVE